jgi:hypothetical protein
MTKENRSPAAWLFLAALVLAVGYLAGSLRGPSPAAAQNAVREKWEASFGFAIPADGAALVRHEDGRAYLVRPDGEVLDVSIGDRRTPTPLRPQ